ncbi:hypothetical protein BV898_18931 [Hypsibius exemplaris]|uniref:Uncharacterized protein n=1 Tax=Hypsibius exemplaris TaxID=2072580 RepID=A0A9X6RPA7_HYPEX|nr:hypothetical protein BV898_18931 [Hypsibius exemplaris]
MSTRGTGCCSGDPSVSKVVLTVTAPLFADEDSKVLAIAAEEAAFATRPPAVTVPPAQLPAVDAGDTRPRSARSRSSSPEIPMTAAPVLPHPPAKRARSPSLSPIIEVKRRLLFPANPMPKKESYVPLPPAKKSQRQSSVGISDEGDSSATTVSSRGSIPPGSPDLWDSAVEMSLSGVFPVLGRRTTRASVCRSSPAPLDAVQRATARRSSRSQTCERKRSENQSAVVLSSGPKKRSGLRVVEATVVKNLVSNGRSKPTWPEVRVSGSRRAQAVAPSTSKKTKVADVSQDVEAVEVPVAKRCGRNDGTSGKKKGRSGKKQSKAVVLDLPESPDSAAFSVISSVSFLSGTPLDDNPLHVVASTPSPSPRKSARLLLSCSPEVPFYPDVPAPTGPRSCLRNTETMHDGTYRRSPRKVKISGKIDHRFFEPEYNVLPPYISDSSIEPDPGPYFVDPQDLDLEPDYFGTVKYRARLEMSVFRKNQVDELMSMLKTTETSLVSKQPAQLCLLVGQDGFFAASHWPEELVSHLFTNIQRSRRAHGLNSSHPGGIPIGLTPGEFVGLTFPVVRFLLEQLQPPVNSASVYSRSFFPKEALKGRLKVDLPQSEQSFPSRREASCVTCSLPSHCFTVSNGRTYTRVPVMERQVVLKWSAPYRVVPDGKTASPKWIRVFNSSYVDPGSFPDYYDDIRHDKKQTFVLSYALHPSPQVVSLALIAKKNFAPGTEVRFDPGRDVYRVDEALGVKDFSCARHGRSF